MAPSVDSASNRNEYQVYFLGRKGSRCVRLTTLPLFCAVVMKSGNLKFLEPSGPLLACNGTHLPFTSKVMSFQTLPEDIRDVIEVSVIAPCKTVNSTDDLKDLVMKWLRRGNISIM